MICQDCEGEPGRQSWESLREPEEAQGTLGPSEVLELWCLSCSGGPSASLPTLGPSAALSSQEEAVLGPSTYVDCIGTASSFLRESLSTDKAPLTPFLIQGAGHAVACLYPQEGVDMPVAGRTRGAVEAGRPVPSPHPRKPWAVPSPAASLALTSNARPLDGDAWKA